MSTENLPIDDNHAGYAWDLEDRSKLFADAIELPRSFMAFETPDEIDPRPWHKIENQGPVGSCQGHAISSCCEALYRTATGGEVLHLSRGYAYMRSQQIDGLLGSDRGSTIRGGVEAAMDGFPTESAVPYVANYRSLLSQFRQVNQEVLRDAKQYAVKTKVVMRTAEDVRQFVGGGGAVSIGIRWPVQIDRNATVTRFGGGGRGGHAIAILGYLKDRRFVVANSHSTRYGDQGWFYVTPNALDQMIRDRYTACIGVSDMPAVEPRRVDWIKESPYA